MNISISREIKERQKELDAFYLKYFGQDEPVQPPPPVESNSHRVAMPDADLIALIERSKQGVRFHQLYYGDTTGYPSASEADLALCNDLAFWTGKNMEQMDRIFRQSKLMRPDKWDQKHGAETYGAMTLSKAIAGCAESYKAKQKIAPCSLSLREGLSALIVKEEYVVMIGNEEWIFKYLIIKNQIVVIIAKSGGGKTTISFDFICAWIIKHHDMTVYYFDLDSPASDHARMYEKAKEMGPRFNWINPLTHGKGPDELVEILKQFVALGERLDDAVFFFDTLKKFIDVLDKKSVKPFFNLLRQLTALGATVVLLGHANKHRANDGTLVFEGVGDIQSDSDALIFFERMVSPDGGQHITTVVDPDKGAKVRGLYEQITFHIAKDRTVTLCEKVVPVPDFRPVSAKEGKLTEEEIQDRIREYLSEQTEPVQQASITEALKGVPGAAINRVRNILNTCTIPQGEATQPGQIYCTEGSLYNRKFYSVVK